MAQPKEFSRTPGNNSSLDGINCSEGNTLTADLDNLVRSLMAALGTSDGDIDFGGAFRVLVDKIGESTANEGVEVDGLLIKDGDLPNLNYATPDVAGTIKWFAGPGVDPLGSDYLECDGSEVSRTTYADLYAAIGDTWGAGNGTTTFNLPPNDVLFRVAGTETVGTQKGSDTVTIERTNLPAESLDIPVYTGGTGSTTRVNLALQDGAPGGTAVDATENLGSGTPLSVQNPYAVVRAFIKATNS